MGLWVTLPFTDDEFSALFLLKHKADVDVKRGGDGYTPLHLTSGQKSVEVAQKLLDNGAPLEAESTDGM